MKHALLCPICDARPLADAVPIVRGRESWAELGCFECLRRVSLREAKVAFATLRFVYALQSLARAALLPRFSPTALLRQALMRGGLSLEEFQAQQSGRLYVQMYGDELKRLRTCGALLTLLEEVARADGEVDAAEQVRIQSLLAVLHKDEPELWQQISSASPIPLGDALTHLRAVIRTPDHALILRLMLSVAERSGGAAEVELQRIGELGQALQIDATLLDEVLGPWRAAATSEGPPQQSDWAVLGLDLGASQAEIRKTYLRLAMDNHPDRFAHLGPAAAQQANERMKQINAAYRALRTKSR